MVFSRARPDGFHDAADGFDHAPGLVMGDHVAGVVGDEDPTMAGKAREANLVALPVGLICVDGGARDRQLRRERRGIAWRRAITGIP